MNNPLHTVLSKIKNFVDTFLIPILRGLIGKWEWQPPNWLKKISSPFSRLYNFLQQKVISFKASSPKQFYLALLLLVAVLFGGYKGYLWYLNRPQPHLITFNINNPKATSTYSDKKIRPLIIKFSGSAAPLELIGKEVKTNFTLTPPLPSNLKWISDSELQLFPTSDWEVGKSYGIKFNRSFFAGHILLENYNLEFITPEFKPTITKSSFYEDPLNPKIKKVVATVALTHPINKSIFEKSIGIKMRIEPIKNFDDQEVKNLGFKVTYDDLDLKAYIHSDQIDIPENTGEVLLTIAKGVPSALGGPATTEEVKKTIRIPGIEDYFRINEVNDSINTNEKDEPEHLATLTASTKLKTKELAKKIKVYQLPKDKPAMGTEAEQKDYYWNDPLEVTSTVLGKAKKIDIDLIPTELEYAAEQSFKFNADNNSYLYILVEKGLPSFGDYKLSKDYKAIIQVDDFPRMLKIMSEGGLLSLSGEKKLSIISRYIPEVKIEINRLLPATVNHLVAVTLGNFQTPQFKTKYSGFDVENIAEKFVDVKTMPDFESGKNQYSLLDFQSFMKKDLPPRGLFYVKLSPNKKEATPEKKKVVTVEDENSESEFSEEERNDYYEGGEDEIVDQRLVLITDLGILVKDSADGVHDIFIMSLKEGKPVLGAKVDLIGKNGLPILSAITTDDGKVTFPNTVDFKNERTPIAYIVQKDDDFSFLPYNRNDRKLNLSRFDTGGIFNKGRNDAIQAFAFSDRGIYRPGDTINLGFVVKQLNWEVLPDGLPLELSVTNPKGSEVQKETIRFSPSGFKEFHFNTYENSITGRYNFSLYIQNDGKRGSFLASTSTKVEEFQPDRLKVKSNLSVTSKKGWISPANVKALINAQNLFGTPAAGSLVRAEMKLTPGYNYFDEYPEYNFHTPKIIRQSYDQKLGEEQSDEKGNVEFDLGLNNFVQNLYHLSFTAEVFEEGSGRSVSTATSALVSDKAFIIGYKKDGDLSYVTKNSSRKVSLVALNSALEKIDLDKISLELVEKKYISTLIKQKDGTFAYESTLEENSLNTKELKLSKDGLDFTLETKAPGSFVILVRNENGEVENEIAYNVTGEANVSTNLEKKAELEVLSNKKEYAPLEEIELNIKVPYSGSGLITIERDKVYAYKWFSTNSTSSIQTIQVPAELEGNGYVTVNFVRSLDSKEIFMSPLSYSSIPFNISREKRTEKIELKVPEIIKPGEMLKIGYKTEHPADLVIFAVDEGILQFAKYKTPDPLSHFYRKRALEVKTSQILDLLLPEYSILKELSAAGGDEGVTLSKHLNPFKRKNQKPVVFWSGIISSSGEAGELLYQVPEYFNGSIKVMAVAVSPGTIGVNEKKATVKADFIIQANAPYFVAPGDEFELGALIANNLQGSGVNAKVNFKIEVCPELEVVGNSAQDLEISENSDKAANFKVKANQIGVCAIRFIIKSKENIATNSLEMSIRPAQPLMTTFTTKYAQLGFFSGNKEEIIPQRKMSPQLRDVEASASTLPISLAKGFVNYLKNYPHGCTEQIVTQALPGVILGVRQEFGLDAEYVKPKVDYAIKTLQGRQNSEGGFGLWSNGTVSSDFINVYALHFLTEAREQGYDIPNSIMQNAIEYLKTFVAKKSTSANELRAQAYALYILSRNGILTTSWLSSVREQLETQNIKDWKKELTGLYLAATYKLLRLDSDAEKIVKYVDPNFAITNDYQNYFDAIVAKANYFYIISKHFPEIAKDFSAEEILGLVKDISDAEPSTIDIGYTMLALNEYAKLSGKSAENGIKIAEVLADNKINNFSLDNSLFPTAKISPDALKVTFEGTSKAPLFYQLSETGFDLNPPTNSTKAGIELIHELKNVNGNPVSEMKMEDKLFVHLLVRSLDESYPHVAIIDLLPGGFELDLSDDTLGNRNSAVNSGDTWLPEFIDAREDRILFYGNLSSSAKRFVYRIKPINKGKYQVPPAYGEGMYNREVKGYSAASNIEVK